MVVVVVMGDSTRHKDMSGMQPDGLGNCRACLT